MTITRPTDDFVTSNSGGTKGTKLARVDLLPFDTLSAYGPDRDTEPPTRAPRVTYIKCLWCNYAALKQGERAWEGEEQKDHLCSILGQIIANVVGCFPAAVDEPVKFYDNWPPSVLYALAELYGFGSKKYDDHNWEKGYPTTLSIQAMGRHIIGAAVEDKDPESNVDHVICVLWHALAILTFINRGIGDYDDVPGGAE